MAGIKYALFFMLSTLGLLCERLWNRLWAVAAVTLGFAALALFGAVERLGDNGGLIFLTLYILSFLVAFFFTGKTFSFPGRADVQRHMEQVSTLEHRPLETLNDTPAGNPSDETRHLWQLHLKKTAEYVRHLKIYTPRPDVAQRDRYSMRYVALLALLAGIAVAQTDAPARLQSAFAPDIGRLIEQKTAMDLWIVPPAYTHQSAIFLATAGRNMVSRDKIIPVPEGSILKLRLAGRRFAPRISYAGKLYDATKAAGDSFTFDMPLRSSGALHLSYFMHTLGSWSLEAVADMPPDIALQKAETTPQAGTKITYKTYDDYGLTKLTGLISPAPEMAEKLGDRRYTFDIPPSHDTSHVEDLTAHPWAGLSVLLSLEAEDGAGHKTTSAPMGFTLPERHFTNAIAKVLAEERKALFWSQDETTRAAIAAKLAEIASTPALYKGDIRMFLSLAIAAKRLMYRPSDAAIETVQGMLWDMALKFEDGGLSLAQRELRESLQKLSSALDDKNMSKQQLQNMLEDTQKKMQQYVQALASELQQRLQQGKRTPTLPPELAQKFMQNVDLGKLLEQMQQLSKMDSRERLQKMAEALKGAIDNIDMKKFDQMQQQQMQAMESLQDLEGIVRRQQSLLDKTNKDPSPAPEKTREQSALRRMLGDALAKMNEALGDIPGPFAAASQSMKQSEKSLQSGRPQASVPHQKEALKQLQKGLDDAISQMAQSMQQSLLSLGLSATGGFGDGYDPLGRGITVGGDTQIPDEKEQRRVQEIIDELRQRSNEPNRAKVERDYIERLLEE